MPETRMRHRGLRSPPTLGHPRDTPWKPEKQWSQLSQKRGVNGCEQFVKREHLETETKQLRLIPTPLLIEGNTMRMIRLARGPDSHPQQDPGGTALPPMETVSPSQLTHSSPLFG